MQVFINQEDEPSEAKLYRVLGLMRFLISSSVSTTKRVSEWVEWKPRKQKECYWRNCAGMLCVFSGGNAFRLWKMVFDEWGVGMGRAENEKPKKEVLRFQRRDIASSFSLALFLSGSLTHSERGRQNAFWTWAGCGNLSAEKWGKTSPENVWVTRKIDFS